MCDERFDRTEAFAREAESRTQALVRTGRAWSFAELLEGLRREVPGLLDDAPCAHGLPGPEWVHAADAIVERTVRAHLACPSPTPPVLPAATPKRAPLATSPG